MENWYIYIFQMQPYIKKDAKSTVILVSTRQMYDGIIQMNISCLVMDIKALRSSWVLTVNWTNIHYSWNKTTCQMTIYLWFQSMSNIRKDQFSARVNIWKFTRTPSHNFIQLVRVPRSHVKRKDNKNILLSLSMPKQMNMPKQNYNLWTSMPKLVCISLCHCQTS